MKPAGHSGDIGVDMASGDTEAELDEQCDGLVVASLTKRYGKTLALDDLSLHVGHGEVVGLFGRDGAGKTTCFEAIMGLVGIDSGQVILDGRDITRLTIDRRAPLGLGYLKQESSIFGGMTTAENIAAALEHSERDKAVRSRRLEDLLERFSIEYVRDTPSPRLSGGERRRCEVARSMASSPNIMLLDEPFAGIDPLSVNSIKDTIRTLKKLGVGVLMADQNVRETIGIVDRAYVIHFGRLIFDGSPQHMMHDADVRRFYLGEDFV